MLYVITIQTSTTAMKNIYSEPVYIIDDEVQTACELITVTRSMVLQIYPLDECFSFQIGNTLYSSKTKIVNGEPAEYFHNQYSSIKIVIIMLPGFNQIMLQRQINDDWIQIDDQQIYDENCGSLDLRFSGAGLITQINKKCLTNYPFYRVYATEEINEINSLSDVHAQFTIMQLLIDIYIPDWQLQQISKTVFQDLFIQIVVKAQDILVNVNYQQILKHVQDHYQDIKFKPYFAELLKYALTSNTIFQLDNDQALFFIKTLPTHVCQQYDNFQQFKIKMMSILLKDSLKVHSQYDHLIENRVLLQSHDQLFQLDALQDQEIIFNNKELAESLLEYIRMRKIPDEQLVLIQQILLMFPQFRQDYVKLILHFNHPRFVNMFKQKSRQLTLTDLYFLIAAYDQFPPQFQQKISTLCLDNIDRINFALESFKPFLEQQQFFKAFIPQSLNLAFKECTKDLFLCESYAVQNISYIQTLQLPNPVKNFSNIKENEQQILEQLGYEQAVEIKCDQLDNDDSDDEGYSAQCYICLCQLSEPVEFQCSHKICLECLIKVKWGKCFYCKKQVESFMFKDVKYIISKERCLEKFSLKGDTLQ